MHVIKRIDTKTRAGTLIRNRRTHISENIIKRSFLEITLMNIVSHSKFEVLLDTSVKESNKL